MRTTVLIAILGLLAICIIAVSACDSGSSNNESVAPESRNGEESDSEGGSSIVSVATETASGYALSSPNTAGVVSVESALESRRSRRDFQDIPLKEEQLSQLLWAAYGVTLPSTDASHRGGLRTAPSAGSTYPLELYAIVGNVEGIESGVYKYISADHTIERIIDRDIRYELSEAALGQKMVSQAPVALFYSAVFSRTTDRYGERGLSFVYVEAGHSAQNIYLQAEALGLGACATGAFTDSQVRRLLDLPDEEEPVYIMLVGYTDD